jgi:hypothetical protein
MGGGGGKKPGEGVTCGVHLQVSQKNKEIDSLTEQAKNNEIIIVFVLNCAT